MHPDCYSPVSQYPEPPAARPVADLTGAELRDVFAKAAMHSCSHLTAPALVADWAYQVADAMLARRARQ